MGWRYSWIIAVSFCSSWLRTNSFLPQWSELWKSRRVLASKIGKFSFFCAYVTHMAGSSHDALCWDSPICSRCSLASLLTVALHSNLTYLTEVMEVLLKDLMQQKSNTQPKLLLRRTESTVEKLLTNWMSICLYGFLRVCGPQTVRFELMTKQIHFKAFTIRGKHKNTINKTRTRKEP